MAWPLRVLIVEDNPVDAELIVRELRRAGFAPEWSRVDTEPEYLASLDPSLDVILADHQMPQFSATRALELLMQRRPDVPFIIISGTIGEELAVSAMRQGASDYLLKDRLARLGPAVSQALEQSRLRRERQQSVEALRESEERFRQLTETINEVFWLTDLAKNRVFYISPAYERIWGRSCTDLLASPRSWLDAIHPEDHERVLHAATTKQAGGTYDEEYRVIRPDGSIRWIHDRAFPVRDATGRVMRVAGVAEDVTKRRDLETQLRTAQKTEAIAMLAGGVAHDFNNLLLVISGHSEVLALSSLSDDRRRECVAEISRAAERAAALTRQLLAFSRKQMMEPTELDLNGLVTEAEKMLRRLIGEDVQLQTDLQPGLSCVRVDPGQMDQVIMNLAVNARDAMPNGGRLTLQTREVELGSTDVKDYMELRPGGHVLLAISDTGCGMSAEVQARIFDPFFTTKPVGHGTGLGLSVVDGIVKQSGGHITLESAPGRGTTFKIYLPKVAGPPAAPAHSAPSKPVGGSETILLVEDDAQVRFVTALLLGSLGYRVLQAASGEEALRLAEEYGENTHLLMTDVVMPGMSGRDLADALWVRDPGLKVLFQSGYTDDVVVRHDVLHAEVAFLQKPFRFDALAKKVREVLDRP